MEYHLGIAWGIVAAQAQRTVLRALYEYLKAAKDQEYDGKRFAQR